MSSRGYNVATHLRRHAQERPDQPALLFPSRDYRPSAPRWDSLTYLEFDRRSDAYARGFTALGVQRGDRVLMLMKPQLDLWVVLFALFKIGAVPVILDPGMGPRNLLACIERIGCRVLIGIPMVHALRTLYRRPFRSLEIFITVGRRLWWGGTTLEACLHPSDEPFEMAMLEAYDGAAIAFTSGSTGPPKGVSYHQGMWDAAVRSIQQMMDMRAGHVSVQAFAAFAIYDLCWGHTTVIPAFDLSKPAKAPPEAFATAIREHQAQTAFASPIIWRRVAPFCHQRGWKLESLDKAITTGAPTPPEMVRAFAPLLREGVEFHTPYGATEAIPVSHIGSAELLEDCVERTVKGAGTCVGRPAPGIDVRIIRITDDPIPEWEEGLEVERGAIGEIVVAGDQVSVEYKASPEGNAASKIRQGERIFHRMGDLGYLDERGRLWFCGRKAHRIETPGRMIPCVPVEGITNEHPDVFRTALVGVGESGAQEPVLVVEMQKGKTFTPATAGALRALTEGTPYEGVFEKVLPHPGFPTDARHNSKIRRGELREWAARQLR